VDGWVRVRADGRDPRRGARGCGSGAGPRLDCPCFERPLRCPSAGLSSRLVIRRLVAHEACTELEQVWPAGFSRDLHAPQSAASATPAKLPAMTRGPRDGPAPTSPSRPPSSSRPPLRSGMEACGDPTSRHGRRARPGMASKCRRLSVMMGRSAARQQAAIQASLAAMGRPTFSRSATRRLQACDTPES